MTSTSCPVTPPIYQGDTLRVVFLFTDADGAPLNLSVAGTVITYTLVSKRGAAPTLDVNTTDDPGVIAITDGAGGKVTLEVSGATTALWSPDSYLWQIEYSLPGPPVSEGTPVSGAVQMVKAKL